MSNNDKYFSVGIDPAGIGTTGIVIKTFNGLYPQKIMTNIKASNSVDSADQIIMFINKIQKKLEEHDFRFKEVIIELPHGGQEKFKEIKATRELIGILKFYFRMKFRGHLPNHKSKKLLESWKNDKRTSHVRDAEAIIFAHFDELEKAYSCESAWGVNLNVTTKNR